MGARSTTKTRKKTATSKPAKQKKDSADQVVFAFRLISEERELIHKAAGSGKATRFVRGAALAAANGDTKAFQELAEQASNNLK